LEVVGNTIFVEMSYTPSEKGGPKVDLKISIKKDYVKLILITAAVAVLTVATEGLDIPALLLPLGEEAVMFAEVIASALSVGARYVARYASKG